MNDAALKDLLTADVPASELSKLDAPPATAAEHGATGGH